MLKTKLYFSLLAIALIATMGMAAPAEAAPKSLIGTWDVEAVVGGVGAPTLFTFDRGGNFIATGSDATFSTAHGAWERDGGRNYKTTNRAFIFDDDGMVALVFVSNAEIQVSRDGQSFTGNFDAEVQTLDGTVVDSFSGTSSGSRITVSH